MNLTSFFSHVLKIAATAMLAVGSFFTTHQAVIIVPTTNAPSFPIASSTSPAASSSPAQIPGGGAPSGAEPDGDKGSVQASSQPASQPVSKQTTPSVPVDQLNTQTRAALVNIECTVAGNQFEPISGSGVIIDSRGIILTNAHVGQFFLLRNYGAPGNINCVVRTGSPAKAAYTAELLYLPPQWVEDNASQLKAQVATGTGENDYSFLLITGTTNPAGTLPTSFPYLGMGTAAPDIGQQMLLAAYPAGFLSGQLISEDLYASSAFAYVTQLFSFDSSTDHVDLFSVGGSVVSQSGSSGGAVVRPDGTLAGIITTDTTGTTTGDRDLRAITLSHVNSSLSNEGEGGIAQLLEGDVVSKAAYFAANEAPQETNELEAVLEQ